MAAPPAKKKKGLSLEEKRDVILDLFFSSKDVFNLKDLEKLGSRAGVVEKTVKDVVQSLVDDQLVEVDKIGSGNFYWSFPSKTYINQKNAADTVAAQLAAEEAACTALEARLAELAGGREDSAERSAQLRELAALRLEKEGLDKTLAQLAASDPDALKEMVAKALVAKRCADRWTDNVWTLKTHLMEKFGKEAKECDAVLGITDDFDYVA